MHQQGRVRIAPVSSAMIAARSRDPRLMRMRPNASAGHSNMQQQQTGRVAHLMVPSASLTKSMPRIPKFSQSGKSSRDEDRNRDPRSRRNKDDMKTLKSSPSSRDKSKASPSKRSGDRKGSSDDSSPRKKSEDEKKSRSRSRVSKSPAKTSEPQLKDVDLRVLTDSSMKPDSTTNLIASSSKSNKDQLLSDLLNGEDMKSSHEMIPSDDNGKENKPILVVTINAQHVWLWRALLWDL